jgi:CheY-like chemotaxis protein
MEPEGLIMTRILVADDDQDSRDGLSRAVRHAVKRVEVVEAVDGDRAFQAFRSRPFDLAILDLCMPGLTGLQAVRAARQLGITTPVILVSAWATAEVAREAARTGVEDLLEKPVSPLTLVAIVREVMERSLAEPVQLGRPQRVRRRTSRTVGQSQS